MAQKKTKAQAFEDYKQATPRLHADLEDVFAEAVCVDHQSLLPCLVCIWEEPAERPYTDNKTVVQTGKNQSR